MYGAMEYSSGVPRRVIFDNEKVAVKDGFGAHAKKQVGYSALSAHYGFDAVFEYIAIIEHLGMRCSGRVVVFSVL